ncbi:MAG: hypothetical protein ACPG5P_05410, partial [Saprospiraceae bacterium]
YYDRLYDKYLLDSAKTSDVLEYFLIHKEKHPDFNWTTLGDMDHLPSRDDDEYYFLPSEEDDELPF